MSIAPVRTQRDAGQILEMSLTKGRESSSDAIAVSGKCGEIRALRA
jgi:hypothetical protein